MSRLVIAFLPRSKCLLISWLQSPAAVILEPKRIKSVTVSIVSPSVCHEVMGLDAMIFLSFLNAEFSECCMCVCVCVYIYLNHLGILQKLTLHFKSTIFK